MVDYQNALLGNAAVRKARSADSIRDELVNLRDLAAVAPAYRHIANKGYIDYDGTLLIAQAARETRDKLIAQGMTIGIIRTRPKPRSFGVASLGVAGKGSPFRRRRAALTGAAIGSLANLPSAFTQRVTDATDTSEGRASGISPQNAASAALRLPSAKSLGDSVVLYVSGESTLSDMAEELVESDLVRALDSGRVTLPTLRDNLLSLQSELRAYDPDFKILPAKAPQDISFQNIVEAYSTLQHFDLLTRADRFALSPTSKAIIRYTLANTEVARNLRTAADAWATFANSEQGQTFLSTSGKTLSDLLDAAGIAQSKLFSDLRVEEADRIAADAAANFSLETLAAEQQAELDTAAEAADTAATTNTDLPRTEIPADDSATGEPITVDPLETADYNPAKEPAEQPAEQPEQSGGNAFGITSALLPPSSLQPHPALRSFGAEPPSIRNSSIVNRNSQFNPNSKPILALRMPDGQHLIVSGRTRHAIALADPTCKTVKVTLINYDPTIHTDDWVLMTNAGEHITARTATTEHYRTYFTLNPITHAQAIEQGLVPIDPKTGKPTAAYTKGRQEAEHTLAAKAEADAAAAAEAAAAAKAKAEKSLPGQTKWSTPSPKSKPLSDSETKQTLISVAALGLSKYKNDRFQFTHTLTQRKGGTEYTVATDGRRITVISTSTYKEDTDDTTQEWHSNKGEKSKENEQAPKWTQVIPSTFRGETSVDLSYYSFLAKGLKGPAKDKHIDSPLLNNGQFIVVNATDGFLSLNPIYVRDAYKQIVDLGKKLGFPPIVKLQYNDVASPVKFTAEHNGIKWQYVLMPVHRNQEATPGDIILGQQPTIYGEQDTGSFSLKVKPTYTVINDNIGLQEHLNDAVTPIEINFTPTRKKGGEWVKEALDYYLQELAGQSLPIGNTGYTLHIKATKNRAKLATYNASSQPRSEAFKKIKEVIAKSYRIGSETSESREKQSTERADRVKRTATFERFGYPAIINGEACLIWFTGQTKQADAKDVLLAETGVTARKTTGATSPLAASSADGGDIAPGTETLGDTLANVKGKIKGVPEIIKNPQQETSVSSPEAAPLFQDGVLQTANAIVTQPGATLSIRALHASPHNFRKFSTDHMGSGEGAQAYGWGLYFAESEDVNKKYFNDFSIKRDTYLFDGKPMSRADIVALFTEEFAQIDKEHNAPKSAKDIAHTILWDLRDISGGIQGAYSRQSSLIEKRKRQQERNTFGVTNNLIKNSFAALDVLKLLAAHDIQNHPATNYRVELNVDDSNLLDWNNIVDIPNELYDFAFIREDDYTDYTSLKSVFQEMKELGISAGDNGKRPKVTGVQFYLALQEKLRGTRDLSSPAWRKGDKEASEWLAAHGYKGIKYLDGNSRNGDSNPTYNYVIFSGDDIKINAINESGVWSMDEGWQDYTDPTATFSLRRPTARNYATILRERDATLLRVSNYIKRHAQRTTRVIGADTDKKRAGVAFAQANAIISALDKYIFARELINRNTAEYRRLTSLRSLLESFVTTAQKGKLPARRNTKAGELTTAQETRIAIEQMIDATLAERSAAAMPEEGTPTTEELVTTLAADNAEQVISTMLDLMGDIIETHLRNSILDRMATSLRSLRPRHTAAGRFSYEVLRLLRAARIKFSSRPGT